MGFKNYKLRCFASKTKYTQVFHFNQQDSHSHSDLSECTPQGFSHSDLRERTPQGFSHSYLRERMPQGFVLWPEIAYASRLLALRPERAYASRLLALRPESLRLKASRLTRPKVRQERLGYLKFWFWLLIPIYSWSSKIVNACTKYVIHLKNRN